MRMTRKHCANHDRQTVLLATLVREGLSSMGMFNMSLRFRAGSSRETTQESIGHDHVANKNKNCYRQLVLSRESLPCAGCCGHRQHGMDRFHSRFLCPLLNHVGGISPVFNVCSTLTFFAVCGAPRGSDQTQAARAAWLAHLFSFAVGSCLGSRVKAF